MTHLEGVIYDEKPNNVTVYPSCVDVVRSCDGVDINDEFSGIMTHKFSCSIDRYTIAEYISLLQKQNSDLDSQVTQVQAGVVETYEMILAML